VPLLSHRGRIIVAFAAVYIVWGSTYLAIKYAIEDIPTLLMAGSRFLVAGLLLIGWRIQKVKRWPVAEHWRGAAITGVLMLVGGNYAVVWSQTRIASGLAALVVAAVPIWIVILDAFRPGGEKPGIPTVVGVVVGLFGVGLLLDVGALVGGESSGGSRIDPLAFVVLLGGTLSWAIGSLYSTGRSHGADALLAAGMQMLTAGVVLTGLALATGQATDFRWASLDVLSVSSWLYLVFFGSIIGYTAYIWLLKKSRPRRSRPIRMSIH
jgi:drug/metabolite transporter (DMT)-like permease